MELHELERLWKKKHDTLEKSININEKFLRKLNLDQSVTEFEKLLKISVLGRNLAFIYFLISLVFSCIVLKDIEYSIPGFMGGIAMLWSFFYHLGPTRKLRKLDYYDISILELQKHISQFKIRSIASGKYDLLVVLAWLITVVPLLAKVNSKKDLYAYVHISVSGLAITILGVILLFFVNEWFYNRMYGKKLSKVEANLNTILEFEQNK